MRNFLRLIRMWLRPPARDGPRRLGWSIHFAKIKGRKVMIFRRRGKCQSLFLTWTGDLRKRSVN